MKKLKFISSQSSLVILMLFSLITISCESKGQSNEDAVEAPKVSIHEAAFFGNVNAIKAHIAHKSDLNVKDAYGSSPLSIAALFGKPDVAKLLINGGADLNVRSADGSTPLHTAAFFGRTEIVKMLLEKGADSSIKNNYGNTALESVSTDFEDVKGFYDQMSRDLGPMGLKLDYDQLKKARPEIAQLISDADNS
ncbi:ankyrin repeat domain-containing protein [Ekhidna sp.]|uniref:ankyrin repeat domain-containing protein n=1 Tax=Ekhidna sp. TaxID=2608089 RepID=UPI003CCBCA2E